VGGMFYDLDLDTKPDFVQCMKRVYAWYEGDIIDRVPVRFTAHNEEFIEVNKNENWNSLKERWFDTEYQIEKFIKSLEGRVFLGETFPVYFPNLGPNVFAAMLGGELEFGEITSWAHPVIHSIEDINKIKFLEDNEYFKKILELTDYALERCSHKFMVGYTDMHPSLDCADALRGTRDLCMDMYDDEDFVEQLVNACYEPFIPIMDIFHKKLKEKKQLSVSWMNIPSYETMHIPSCDLGAMISKEHFDKFALPYIQKEVKHFKHNIFHLDGKGVARHIQSILQISEIQAIQWVQGVGNDKPIMQWVDFIKQLQNAGKRVIVDLELSELDDFMENVSPVGIYLCIPVKDVDVQKNILKKLLKWK